MNNIFIIEGDLTKVKVDAIVNAENPKMLGEEGVDDVIHRTVGPCLHEECFNIEAVNCIRGPIGGSTNYICGKSAVKVCHSYCRICIETSC